ncbi:MAG: metallophosphoesterase family protein [Candidatus Sumerlaeota bacterium]|nr:metallophosphoesterase family protein [Candidatus Sumerlaeota bacterium]
MSLSGSFRISKKASAHRVATILLFAALTAAMAARMARADEAPQIIAGPYLQCPSESGMTVMWLTNRNATSWVEYGESEALGAKAVRSHDGLVDADMRIHRVALTNLKPGAKYFYKVFSKEVVKFDPYKITYGATVSAGPFSFTAFSRAKPSISFVVFNDIHENDALTSRLMALALQKPFDFAIYNGDILSHLESEEQIVTHLLIPASQGFAAQVPFLYARGNHETRGRFARMLREYIANPGERFYYSFDHGPVHFIILDAGEDKPDSQAVYAGLADFDRYRSEEKTWLEQDIRSDACKKARFRIVISHINLFNQPGAEQGKAEKPEDYGRRDARAKFAAALEEAKTDLHINGHTHQYEVIAPEPGAHSYPIFIGGAPQAGKATLTRVEINNDAINVAQIRDDGQVVNQREIKPRK